MKKLFQILALLLLASPSLHAQTPDTLEWLPVGTEWVYETAGPGSSSYLRYRVEMDTLYRGRLARVVRHRSDSESLTSTVLLSRSGPLGDSIWIALTPQGALPTYVDGWRFYFRVSASLNDSLEFQAPVMNEARFLSLKYSIVFQGDTTVKGFRLPYHELEYASKEITQTFVCGPFGERSSTDWPPLRLSSDFISNIGLFPTSDNLSLAIFPLGCGLRCFTHPQLGTIRFDSPERQAQFPDCHYGTLVTRPGAAAAKAFSVQPNPASDRVEIAFDAPFRRLEAYDAQGRRVHAQGLHAGDRRLTLDVADWPAGVYLLRLEGEGAALQSKLILR